MNPRKVTLLLALAFTVGACTSTRAVLTTPQPQTLGSYLASQHPTDIRVTDRKGGTHWVHHPALDGDTLRGVGTRDLPQLPVAIAVLDLARVDDQHFSAGKTGLMAGSFVLVLGLAAVFLYSHVGTNYGY